MRHYVLIVALALGLSGCASFQAKWDTLTGTQVTAQQVAVLGNTFDSLVPIATAYLRLQKCTADNRPVCRDPVVTKRIISAVRSGRVARNNLEQFFIDHPGKLGPQGLWDAFNAAVSTLQTIQRELPR